MNRRFIFAALAVVGNYFGYAQNVGINSNGANPDASAMLDIVSTNKGVLIPRLTSAQISSMGSVTNGMLVFNTDLNDFVFYNQGDAKWYRTGKGDDNSSAIVAPTAADDSRYGYAIGSLWTDVQADKAYLCVDPTLSAAVWVDISAGDDGNGIYDGDGTVPSGTDVAVTDYINFDANTFYLDGTNNRVGMGTATPSARLDVVGTFQLVDGTQGANKILTSDASGNASWTSNLSVGGSVTLNIRTITAATTVLSTDCVVICDATSGGFTVTLPTAASSTGRVYTFKKLASSNNVTIDGNGAELIDGATTYTLTAAYKSVRIISNGTRWLILGGF